MDLTVLSKKISSYRSPKGQVRNLPHELLAEILHAWEQWNGPSAGFYKALGVDFRKFGSIMGKAKQLKREGAFDGLNFTEIVVEENSIQSTSLAGCSEIEVVWDNNKIIRFKSAELLVEFLKKAA